ncbi:hypothetical protein [Rhodococcoides fascians]|uniref:hypothetical protein n=1 Tax=Rhodococcoides fascians TaxID=1828 RepID=UPI000A3F10DD|nr:hypothetical protein [Rhodococcus fascians]
MELLYVVELDVRASDSTGGENLNVRERIIRHIADWVSFEHTPHLEYSVFEEAGSVSLRNERGGRADARVTWALEGTTDLNALVVTVRTLITHNGRADFICTVTVGSEEGKISVRLELARESLDGVLAPAGINFFRRPHLLALLLRDPALQCWAGPSRVDGRFNWINPKHTEFVWDAITAEGRLLPFLLVDGSGEGGEILARRAANELGGLAPVLAVDARSQRILDEKLNEVDASIPSGGARLIWPDLSLRHPAFSADQAGLATNLLLRMLSSVSITIRGRNRFLQRAVSAHRSARNRQMALEIAEAKAQGNSSVELSTLTRLNNELKTENDELATWFSQVEEERDRYKAQAAQMVFWRQEAERARQASGLRVPAWADAPELSSHDLTELAHFLEAQSQGAILFTRTALQAWKRAEYPHIDSMRESLIVLTKAAMEYRRLEGRIGMVPDDWFKLEWDLTLASTDKYMSKNGLDKFKFEDNTYSRLPHLKLGDHTSPNEVGRVYFSMDSEGERFIVDHVGLKLYGL